MTLLDNLLDLFFPDADRCPFCDREGGFCTNCRTALEQQRIRDDVAVFRYAGIVKEIIHRLKFGDAAHLAAPMAELTAEALSLSGDCITCVPLHPRRERQRGYNQSALFAKRLSELTEIPYQPLIIKVRHTPPQSLMKSTAARQANIRSAFCLHPSADVAGKHILLADDVYTTGATAQECTDLLISAGAASVRTITFAKGGSSWQPQEPCSKEP